MADKKARLIARARETARTPKPSQLFEEGRRQKGYKIVAISLYTPEAEWLDQATRALQIAGSPKANRSLVVREAIDRLRESLRGKSAAEILTDFTTHQSRRAQQG